MNVRMIWCDVGKVEKQTLMTRERESDDVWQKTDQIKRWYEKREKSNIWCVTYKIINDNNLSNRETDVWQK